MKRAKLANLTGSVLLLALWALLLLSMAVLAWATLLQQRVALEQQDTLELEARALAHSGAAIAMHPLVKMATPVLHGRLQPDRTYDATLEGEGGKLNINWLLGGEDPHKLALLENYLTSQKYDYSEIAGFVDCLLDWVDSDNLKRLNGAEEEPNYHPANRVFDSVDEIAKVRGSDKLTARPNWQKNWTVSSKGPLDLNTVSAEILSCVPGVGDLRAESFVRIRQGPDHQDGTLDDYAFKNATQMMGALGFSEAQFQAVADLVTTAPDPAWRIVSIGHAGKVSRQVDAIVKKLPNSTQIISWKDL